MWSSESETLDQLLGGCMPLTLIRELYPDDAAFRRGILGLLRCGDVRLLSTDQAEVPQWRWRELFKGSMVPTLATFILDITDQGAERVA
jgi:hypothetical protein